MNTFLTENVLATGDRQFVNTGLKRIVTLMKLLEGYGAHGKRVVAELEALAVCLKTEETGFPRQLSLGKARVVTQTIQRINASAESPQLIYLKQPKIGDWSNFPGPSRA